MQVLIFEHFMRRVLGFSYQGWLLFAFHMNKEENIFFWCLSLTLYMHGILVQTLVVEFQMEVQRLKCWRLFLVLYVIIYENYQSYEISCVYLVSDTCIALNTLLFYCWILLINTLHDHKPWHINRSTRILDQLSLYALYSVLFFKNL